MKVSTVLELQWTDTAEYQGRRLILAFRALHLTLQPRQRSVAVDYLQ